jgi:hypothetical protein
MSTKKQPNLVIELLCSYLLFMFILIKLPQYDSYISRMLTYSQDFITLENTLTVKSIELRLL